MINFLKTEFTSSLVTQNTGTISVLPEVVFIGRSNVGKSSLINALINRKNLAYTSKKAGLTKLLNYYNVDNTFYLVDAPGYGFARNQKGLGEGFSTMMNTYLIDNPNLKHIFMLLDPRVLLTPEDKAFIEFCQYHKLPFTVVYTKGDKLNQSEKQKAINYSLASFNVKPLFVSSLKKTNIDKLQNYITDLVV